MLICGSGVVQGATDRASVGLVASLQPRASAPHSPAAVKLTMSHQAPAGKPMLLPTNRTLSPVPLTNPSLAPSTGNPAHLTEPSKGATNPAAAADSSHHRLCPAGPSADKDFELCRPSVPTSGATTAVLDAPAELAHDAAPGADRTVRQPAQQMMTAAQLSAQEAQVPAAGSTEQTPKAGQAKVLMNPQ